MILTFGFGNVFSQTNESQERPTYGVGEISVLNYGDRGINNEFGSTTLLGAGIETNISERFNFQGLVRNGKSSSDGVELSYTEIGATVKWATIGGGFKSDDMRVYGKLGPKYISIEVSGDGESENGNTLGFGFGLGIEFPLGGGSAIYSEWDTNMANVEIAESNVDVNNNIFSIGMKFEL